MYYDENDPEEIACRDARWRIRDELKRAGFSQKGRLYEFSHQTMSAVDTEQLFRDLLLQYSSDCSYEVDISSWNAIIRSRYLGLEISVSNQGISESLFEVCKQNLSAFERPFLRK